jgi:hypothetical protein
MKKDTYNDIFARRLLKNKIILRLQARITYSFHNLIGKNHFAVCNVSLLDRMFFPFPGRQG